MSDKRFKKGDNLSCRDTETGKSYYYACNLSGLLNRYQTTIQELQEENEQLKKRNKFLEEFDGRAKTVANLKEENEKLRFLIDINSVSERKKLERQVDEQQATISALKKENRQMAEKLFILNEKYGL